jgi:hypothetical protein
VYVPRDNVLVLPAELVSETADSAVLAAGLQPQNPQGLGNDNALLLVVGGRDTLEGLETLHGGVTAGGLVGNHATDGAPEHLGGSAEVEGTTTGGVETGLLAHESLVLDCAPCQSMLSRDISKNAPRKSKGTWRRVDQCMGGLFAMPSVTLGCALCSSSSRFGGPG